MLRLSVNLKSQSSVLISSTLKCVELGLFISLRMRTLFRLKLKGDEDGILVSGLEIQTKTRSVKILACARLSDSEDVAKTRSRVFTIAAHDYLGAWNRLSKSMFL